MERFQHRKTLKFSVVIPAYNAEKYLLDAINSVLRQTYTEFELIVVDDGSTDSTAEILSNINDDRVLLIQRPNGGLAAARNSGIKAAKGEFVAFLDADDRWLPNKLSAHNLVLENNPEISVTFDWSTFIDEDGNATGLGLSQTKKEITHDALMVKNLLGNGSTSVVRRTVLQEFNGFDEELFRLVDRELWVRLTYNKHKFLLVPQVLTEYRQHSDSLTSDIDRILAGLDEFFSRIALYAPESVEKYQDLARACMHRWIARAEFLRRDYPSARKHMKMSLRSNISVLWKDPRALITFLAISLQYLLPTQLYEQLFKVGITFASRKFNVSS